jgi:hypothetical protein
MMTQAIALRTNESVEEITNRGFTGNWSTRLDRAQEHRFVVLVRNAKHPSAPADVVHDTAFLICRIGGVREVAERTTDGRPRIAIDVTHVAPINVPGAWGDSRNPVAYVDLNMLGINVDDLDFQEVHPTLGSPMPNDVDAGLTFDEARAALARRYGVKPSAVEICIRG